MSVIVGDIRPARDVGRNQPERSRAVRISGLVTSRFGTLRQTPASFGLFRLRDRHFTPLSSKAGMVARRARKMDIYFRDVRLVLFLYSLVPDFDYYVSVIM